MKGDKLVIEAPASTNSLEVRERLVDAVRLDLYGPWVGHPLNNEQLPGWVRPSNWYLTGFIVPSGISPEKKGDADEDDDFEVVAEIAGSDLIRLSWSHVHADTITISTGKSKHRREAIIPLYDALRNILANISRRSTVILTNSRHRPWTRDGLGSSFNKAKIAAGMAERDLHFHDLRGTAATQFYIAGLSERVIAEIMGWQEEHVAWIIRRYVNRSAATKAMIAQLNERRT
jgi:Phage integrase family